MNKNREIKFRVWIPNEKKFYYSDTKGQPLIYLNGDVIEISYGEIMSKEPEAVLQQFIGLIDLNKKEIYEGDIIQEHHYEDWSDEKGFTYTGTIYWSPIACGFRSLPTPNVDLSGNKITSECKVIGNIFEIINNIKNRQPELNLV